MPRYAILHHDCPPGYTRASHWDLMLEQAEGLRTWALPRAPAAGETMIAEALPDHRLAYLDYEGALPGGRGSVRRWDAGSYQLENESQAALTIVLAGQQFAGRLVMERLANQADRWRVECVAG